MGLFQQGIYDVTYRGLAACTERGYDPIQEQYTDRSDGMKD